MAKRARADWTVDNANLKVKAEFLFATAVPLSKRLTDEEKAADPKAQPKLYHVNIRFADFEDLKMRACEKVLHDVGKAIDAGKIAFTDNPAEYTTVDSSGYPPASFEDLKKKIDPAVDSATDDKTKAEMKKYLAELLKKLG